MVAATVIGVAAFFAPARASNARSLIGPHLTGSTQPNGRDM
jgi:hypothetical protein